MSFSKFDQLCQIKEVPAFPEGHPFFNLPGKVRGITQIPGTLHVHIIADDSGSMWATDQGESQPRYLEQRDRLTEVAEWALSLNVPVYFSTLNDSHKMVQLNPENGHQFVYKALSTLKYGYTPLYDTLYPILNYHHALDANGQLQSEKVTKLIFIGTDGAPSTTTGLDDKARFKNLVLHERDPQHNHLVFLACVGGDKQKQDHPLNYINELDTCPYIDCFDDFNNEKEEVNADMRGQYTVGVNILRMFASTFYQELDNLDEH
mgnify:CR=1 FL=1